MIRPVSVKLKPGMRGTAVFTTISRNYFGLARTLMQSLEATNPAWDRFLVLVDDPDGFSLDDDLCTVIALDDIGLPGLKRMAFRYDISELNKNVVPWGLRYLLEKKGYERAVYLAPHILVLRELAEANAALDSSEIVLTPHLTAPLDDDLKPGEVDILRAGAYDMDFLAVRKSDDTGRMLDWWSSRLECAGCAEGVDGLTGAQRWLDLVPGMFGPVQLLCDDGYDVAYWNLPTRQVTERDGKLYVNDDELAFFNFSGMDPEHPFLFSKHQDRYNLSTVPELVETLVVQYCLQVLGNDYLKHREAPYAFDFFHDGRKIPWFARRLYREMPGCEEACGDDPFAHPKVFFHDALAKVYRSRSDVQQTFPDPGGKDRTGLVRWFVHSAYVNKEFDLPYLKHYEALLNKPRISAADIGFVAPTPAQVARTGAGVALRKARSAAKLVVPRILRNASLQVIESLDRDDVDVALKAYAYDKNAYHASTLPAGVNLYGYLAAEMGLGEGARTLIRALRAGDVPVSPRRIGNLATSLRSSEFSDGEADELDRLTNIWYANAPEMVGVFGKVGPEHLEGHYNIGVWAWELLEFPEEDAKPAGLLHEIWAISQFVVDCIQPKVDIPVIRIPPAISTEYDAQLTRADFGIPEDRFTFLSMYDVNSTRQRKNPRGAIDAFLKAFGDDDSVHLIVKVNSANATPEEFRLLTSEFERHKNISFMAKNLRRRELNSFIRLNDCFVSLHRSEGFGLVLAESMSLGLPVIGTGWSGNLDFMTSDNSCLVDCKLVKLDGDFGQYRKGSTWADPDVDEASAYMARLVADRQYREAIASNGQQTILREFSPRAVGEMAMMRLKEVGVL